LRITSVTLIWCQANHNAFTDLCLFKRQLFCCFREADNHISGDGAIRVLTLNSQYHPTYQQSLRVREADLRDPKLSITPDGKLLLLAYARFRDNNNKSIGAKPYCWFSTDGISWSSPTILTVKSGWLWRLSFHRDFAMGFAYNRGQERLSLYKGNPLRAFHCISQNTLSKKQHGLGYPNESDIIFDSNDNAYALVRRDADTGSAQLGHSKPPYTQWSWSNLKHYFGGPAMIRLNDEHAIAGGRLWTSSGPKMALFTLNLKAAKMSPTLILPSAGDSSYPGLVLTEGKLLVSYYSSHTDNKSAIYLAEVAIDNFMHNLDSLT
jgi:hypothetical protein